MKIIIKKTKSPMLGISEVEKVRLGKDKIDQVGNYNYLRSIISKDGGSSEYVKSRIVKVQGVFFTIKYFLEEREDKPENQD